VDVVAIRVAGYPLVRGGIMNRTVLALDVRDMRGYTEAARVRLRACQRLAAAGVKQVSPYAELGWTGLIAGWAGDRDSYAVPVMKSVLLYFDLGSPYAYLAVARAQAVFGRPVDLEPVLLGAIFKLRGSGSWSRTAERAAGIAEVQRRASSYGLPAVVWPEGWPLDGLRTMRAATWAKQKNTIDAFADAVFAHQFVNGRDLSGVDALAAVAEEVGLSGDELRAAVDSPAVKDELKSATARAWEHGVRGVPTVRVGQRLFYGDDQLEVAAAHLPG
jgi:2-hydroxychromene-2-carboxylate isomerase